MEGIIISQISSAHPKYGAVLELREEVLRRPLGRSLKNEDLSRDHIDTIFIAEYDDKVIGCVLLHHLDQVRLQLRAMAVYNEWRGKGIGRLLVTAAEEFAVQKSYEAIILHARKVALGFYTTLGYNITSDEFVEVGIPHYIMEKNVSH
jgi:predicted GNAT family N-acyltransferase